MPNHTPEHLRLLSRRSASVRRAAKLEQLIASSPPLDREVVVNLCRLLSGKAVHGGGR